MTIYREERQHLIDCARKMERYGLVVLSGGNVSMRMPDGNFLVTPSAMGYDNMQPEDIVLIDASGRTLDGIRRPSSDSAALLYIQPPSDITSSSTPTNLMPLRLGLFAMNYPRILSLSLTN